MQLKNPVLVIFYIGAGLILAASACVPAATAFPQTAMKPVATPTPEIFQPIVPSPTPSGSALPLTCQVTDLSVYVNEEWGYCFAYPGEYTVDQSQAQEGIVRLNGPALDENPDPIHVSLEVTPRLVPAGSVLAPMADAYLSLFKDVTMPIPTSREPWRLGNEPAEKLDPIPGLLSSRVILALHQNVLYQLRFHPSDIDYAEQSLDDLTQTVTGSFAFLDGSVPPASRKQDISWTEFGRNISLTYDSTLAPWVEAGWVPESPQDDGMMPAGSHPQYVRFRFAGYQGGMPYELPLRVEDPVPQVMIFRTTDFPGFGDGSPLGFAQQRQALEDMLGSGLDSDRCGRPQPPEPSLPYLPWINMKQSFCAHPQVIEFPGGKGIRYLTYYAQSPMPVLEPRVFYTFQGLTDDGQFYISALLPVSTGIFPARMPPCPKCDDPAYNPLPEWDATRQEQIKQLNARQADDFEPSLTVLDELIRSIQIEEVPADLGEYFQGFDGCFVLYDMQADRYTRYNPERCAGRLLPASTFKILNALIGLETGAIPDENYVIPWDGTQYEIDSWNQDHTLKTAFQNSVVWYYQEVARRVGSETMQHYIDAVGYGNRDMTGSLDSFWLDGALRISADEQVEFLKRLYANDLPFSKRSMEIVKDMMILNTDPELQIRGKTGTAMRADSQYAGWFVGYQQVNGNVYIFATNITGNRPDANGPKAREITLDILKENR